VGRKRLGAKPGGHKNLRQPHRQPFWPGRLYIALRKHGPKGPTAAMAGRRRHGGAPTWGTPRFPLSVWLPALLGADSACPHHRRNPDSTAVPRLTTPALLGGSTKPANVQRSGNPTGYGYDIYAATAAPACGPEPPGMPHHPGGRWWGNPHRSAVGGGHGGQRACPKTCFLGDLVRILVRKQQKQNFNRERARAESGLAFLFVGVEFPSYWPFGLPAEPEKTGKSNLQRGTRARGKKLIAQAFGLAPTSLFRPVRAEDRQRRRAGELPFSAGACE